MRSIRHEENMLKTRIILASSTVLIVILLFNLPKVVVDNDAEEQSVVNNEVTAESASPKPATTLDHNFQLSDEENSTLSSLKSSFSKTENPKESVTFADSLAQFFYNKSIFDSAAYYHGWIATNFPNEENLLKAGNSYYEAFRFAVDLEKAKSMGEKSRSFFSQIPESSEKKLEVKTKMAMTYIPTSNPMQGILMLREVVEEDPSNQEALFNLGLLSRQSGQKKKAVERLETLVKVNPEHLQGRLVLGLTYLEMGKKEQAKEQLLIVKELDNDPQLQAEVDSYLEEIDK